MRSRPIIPLTRRQFLVGAGGFSLALPVLSSLCVKTAYGADPVFVRKPRLFWLATNHGAASEAAFFPPESQLTMTQQLFADHSVRAGALQSSTAGANRVISPVLQAHGSRLTAQRVSQLNVLRGLDIPFGIAHHTGGHLGNYARNDGLGGPALEAQSSPRPTIDQLLAWSPTFYDDLSATRERALVLGSREISFGFSNPGLSTGTVQSIRGEDSSLALFNRIFVPQSSTVHARAPVVDRVIESYRRLRNGNRRLSSADKQRLDDHMDRMAELQRKLHVQLPASCAEIAVPAQDTGSTVTTDRAGAVRYAQLFNEVAAAAFICGSSRIAVLGLSDDQHFTDYAGDWHNEVAHEWQVPEKQALLQTAYQRVFEDVFLDMVARLDNEEAPGMTYLDNSLLVWSQESGMSTHDPVSLPIVTAGSAAGALRTGLSVDYRRNGDPDSRFDPQADGYYLYAGLTYNQFLATVLQAMGLPRSEFELWGHRGYGLPLVDPPDYGILPFAKHYQDSSSRYFQIASDVLPFLRA